MRTPTSLVLLFSTIAGLLSGCGDSSKGTAPDADAGRGGDDAAPSQEPDATVNGCKKNGGACVISATCNSDCSAATCGDGILNEAAKEACDDGNVDPLDGCHACRSYDGWSVEVDAEGDGFYGIETGRDGSVFLAGSTKIARYDAQGKLLWTITPTTEGPRRLAVADDGICVLGADSVGKWDRDGQELWTTEGLAPDDSRSVFGTGICAMDANGNVWLFSTLQINASRVQGLWVQKYANVDGAAVWPQPLHLEDSSRYPLAARTTSDGKAQVVAQQGDDTFGVLSFGAQGEHDFFEDEDIQPSGRLTSYRWAAAFFAKGGFAYAVSGESFDDAPAAAGRVSSEFENAWQRNDLWTDDTARYGDIAAEVHVFGEDQVLVRAGTFDSSVLTHLDSKGETVASAAFRALSFKETAVSSDGRIAVAYALDGKARLASLPVAQLASATTK